MAPQMIFRQIDELLGRRRGIVGEELRIDVTAELLNPYFIEPCL